MRTSALRGVKFAPVQGETVMKQLQHYLQQQATGNIVSGKCLDEARTRFSLTHAEVERLALQFSLLPARYQRNQQAISLAQQRTLNASRVSVVGCGGLGGYILEQLARLGVGRIQIIDGDDFEEHNLNRQLYSSEQVLGESKVDVAARRIREINPATLVIPVKARLDSGNASRLLQDADVVADAVDNLDTRHLVAATCRELGLPMVHGAIGGWYGHVTTIYPEDTGLDKIYPQQTGRGIEQELGNPAFTPAVIASLQAAEVCKVLLGAQGQLRHRQLVVDLLHMEIHEVAL